jgi:hypothetical protein
VSPIAVRVSYILPLRTSRRTEDELDAYLRWLSRVVDLVVADGSNRDVFECHAQRWRDIPLRHLAVDGDLEHLVNGKVSGVLTALRRARHEFIIIADDDVRYDEAGLHAMTSALLDADVVRPQNYFDTLPWHAWLDTGRTLLNRMSGGDWPGTIGVRRTILTTAGGYSGDVLFENLELVRTVVAAGGVAVCPLDLYVRRRPPTASHFWSQRVRQAYDEFARPHRLALWLAVLPVAAFLTFWHEWKVIGLAMVAVAATAEAGRRRCSGSRVFPFATSLAAPLWICERAVCAWLAAGSRLVWGGIYYRGRVVARAATPLRALQHRLRGA